MRPTNDRPARHAASRPRRGGFSRRAAPTPEARRRCLARVLAGEALDVDWRGSLWWGYGYTNIDHEVRSLAAAQRAQPALLPVRDAGTAERPETLR